MKGSVLTRNFAENSALLDKEFRLGKSFDLVARKLEIGGKQACLYFVDGFVKDSLMQRIIQYFYGLKPEDVADTSHIDRISGRIVPYLEVDTSGDVSQIVQQVLSGVAAFIIDGFTEAFLVDTRTYPSRGVEEPDSDHVLRGAHDGFVETLVFNTALIRRRIRDPRLTMEIHSVGSASHADIVLCYMEGKADEKLVKKLRAQLDSIDIPTITLGQQSLMECLCRRQWYNPFPKVRYTERPDCASAAVAEGQILIITDNTPAVMILPTGVFDFTQDANDYYFPPLIGSYLRLVRMVIFVATLVLTPIWLALIMKPDNLPLWLDFVRIKEPNHVPVIVQLLIIELIVDGLKIASLNTPNALSNAFSVVGALILGDFAVSAELFVPEVLLYMAFVAISTFTQPSFELGYAFKLFRILLLILTALFRWWGFAAGLVVMVIMMATTRTIGNTSYLAPLIPWNWTKLKRLLVRRAIHPGNS